MKLNKKKAAMYFLLGLLAIYLVGFVYWKITGYVYEPDQAALPWVPDKMLSAGYHEAGDKKPAGDPGEKIQQAEEAGGSPVLGGQGTLVLGTDTLEVEVVGVEGPDGSKWLGSWINGQPVIFKDLWWIDTEDPPSPWDGIVECAWVGDEFDMGIGVARFIVEELPIVPAQTSLFLTADLNSDLTDPPDWMAAGVRLSGQHGPVSWGLDIGGRIMEDAGWHAGGSLGYDIGNLEDIF